MEHRLAVFGESKLERENTGTHKLTEFVLILHRN